MPLLKCMPLREVTDGPLMTAPEGTLSRLQNMRLRPGGFAEGRGGLDKLKPSGGTAADAISAGAYSAVHQISTSYGWVRTFNSAGGVGNQYSGNTQLASGGYSPFPSDAVNDAIYWGADFLFGRVAVSLSIAQNYATFSYAYEYWNGTVWSALTTSETIDWTVVSTLQFCSWTIPTDWATTTIGDSGSGNVLKYWMRIRLTAVTGVTTGARIRLANGYWAGMRELYALSQSPRTSATAGTLKRHGQTGTTEEWFSISSTVSSMPANPNRAVAYRGRLFFVNGRDQKSWDGAYYLDIGSIAFAPTPSLSRQAGTGMGAGIWRYYAAWGRGRCGNVSVYATQQDASPLYGVGRAVLIVPTANADPADANSIQTTAGNEQVLVGIPTAPPAGVSSYFIYKTQDLTNVPVGQRGSFPAFLVQSLRIRKDQDSFEPNLASYTDSNSAPLFPTIEAITYDNSPPTQCKFIGVYQNRLFLGDSDTWYWSDPFAPDSFTLKSTTGYIRLARALGGRHMGGTEFADQFVMWTEDQTWGVTNIDLDVPQLYPIHVGIGCIAPDAIAAGDGLLIWPAKDGFYAWDGNPGASPTKISGSMDYTFGRMNYENHGGSRATIHHRQYDVRLAAPDGSAPTLAYRFDFDTGMWSRIVLAGFTSTLFPISSIHAPLGNSDAGVLHPVWAKIDYGTGAGDYSLFLGELTTQDNGVSYTCLGIMHFPLAPGETFSPSRVMAYYDKDVGWGVPSFLFSTSDIIGGSVGTISTGTPDTGDDYSVIGGTFSGISSGASDLKVTFTVNSAAGGTLRSQRFFGGVLEGEHAGIRLGGV